MRILQVGKYFSPFSGGLENYMLDTIVALGQRGVRCAALVHRHTWSILTREEIFTAGGQEFPVVRTGRIANILFTPISPAFPLRLRRLIHSLRPGLLHLHLPNPSAFWALLLPSARRLPWLVHWHADVITAAQGWPMRIMYALYRPFEQALLRRAEFIVATSRPYLESSEPLEPWIEKCRVVPLGVDTDRFACAESPRQTARDSGKQTYLNVLAVGRLTYYKGLRYLVEAVAQVENLRLDIIGHGDQAAELKELAAKLELQERVRFHGTLDGCELARRLACCDCLCLPSVERTEAFGLVLLEAMYFGKATVVSDLPGSGMGWIVDDGITGIKVKPADADALANAFRRLAVDRGELQRLGQAGREKFEREFEINHAVDGIMALYRSLVPDGTDR